MKILTTISYYSPHVSGLTICARRLVDGLAILGYDFTVLTSQHRVALPRQELYGSVRIIRSPILFTLGKVPVMPLYFFDFLRLLSQAELVWVHLPQAEGVIVAFLAKLFRRPVVVTLHCLPILPSGWQRMLFQRMFDGLNNLTIRLADRAVYYTQDYAENTKELAHFPEKSRYILPPAPTGREARSAKLVAQKIRGRNQPFTVGFAGRVAEDKGLEFLLEALELLKHQGVTIKLLIAGAREAIGEQNYRQKIEKLLTSHSLDVQFLGEISPSEMSRFYQHIDCLVLPSVNRTEAFGLVQAEAMFHGIPVIASDLPGVRVPIQLTKVGFLVPPRDAAAMARAIKDIAKKPFGRQHVREAYKIFSLEKTLDAYQRCFIQLKN